MIDKEIMEAAERAAERYATGNHSASFPDSAEKRAYLAGALKFGEKWAEWAREDEKARAAERLFDLGTIDENMRGYLKGIAAEKRKKLLE